ncbi:MAG: hypothetical protein IKX02_03275, partial [Spirochaetales bacterium]|nr:hypothetical protein [Spirochaetales bacterium]
LGRTIRKEPLEYLKRSASTAARGSLRMPPIVIGNFFEQKVSTSLLWAGRGLKREVRSLMKSLINFTGLRYHKKIII